MNSEERKHIKNLLFKTLTLQVNKYDGEHYECEVIIDNSIVNINSVNNLLSDLTSNYSYEVKEYSQKSYIDNDNSAAIFRHRKFKDGTEDIQCKSRLFVENLENLWSRIIVSCEKTLDKDFIRNFHNTKSSDIQRVSVKCPTEKGYFIIDISNSSDNKFWVEVEIPFDTIENYDRDFDALSEIYIDVIKYIVTSLQNHNQFIPKKDQELVKKLMSFGYAKPITLNLKNVKAIKSCKYISEKYDGTRYFLVYVNKTLFRVDVKGTVEIIQVNTDIEDTNVLDCEKVNDTYYIIDVVYYKNRNVLEEDTSKRLNYRADFQADNIKIKEFVELTCINQVAELYNRLSDISDGIIFVGNEYKNVYKWKMDNTIDLYLRDGVLYDSNGNEYQAENVDNSLNNIVCEFSVKENKLIYLRSRPDKPKPNSYAIIMKNITHTFPIELFSGEGAFFMRKYHNEVKKSLLQEGINFYTNIQNKVLLDIGSGQLGDITKWDQFKTIYCVEPNVELFREGLNRVKNFKVKSIISPIHYKLSRYSEFDHMMPKKACIVTLFFCMNLFDTSDFTALRKILKYQTSKYATVYITALMNPIEDNNECFQLEKINNKSFKISIKSTRINNLIENIIQKNALLKYFASLNYELARNEVLNADTFMSSNELKLSSMYELFVFKRIE